MTNHFNFDKYSTLATTISDILTKLGFDNYGEYYEADNQLKSKTSLVINEEFADKTHPTVITGSRITNPDGKLLMIIRPYSWSEIPEIEDLPNLVIPRLNFEMSWYKYMFRDAETTQNTENPDCRQSLIQFFNQLVA